MTTDRSDRYAQMKRIFDVLNCLADGRLHDLRELSRVANTSERTILRYIDVLNVVGFAVEKDTMGGCRIYYQLVNPKSADVLKRRVS
jgi:predicted DNA-binding transcriptional regulator YafY